MTPQPIDLDRQPNANLPTRAALHQLHRRARSLAQRVAERSASLAEVDELAELVVTLTANLATEGA